MLPIVYDSWFPTKRYANHIGILKYADIAQPKRVLWKTFVNAQPNRVLWQTFVNESSFGLVRLHSTSIERLVANQWMAIYCQPISNKQIYGTLLLLWLYLYNTMSYNRPLLHIHPCNPVYADLHESSQQTGDHWYSRSLYIFLSLPDIHFEGVAGFPISPV